jgi:hypothetical protein
MYRASRINKGLVAKKAGTNILFTIFQPHKTLKPLKTVNAVPAPHHAVLRLITEPYDTSIFVEN